MNNTQSADNLPSNDLLVKLIASQAKRLLDIQTWNPVIAESNRQALAAIYRQMQSVESAWLSEAARQQSQMRELSKPLPYKGGGK